MAILQRDEAGFEETQHDDAADKDDGRPEHEVNPDRRGKFHFDDGAQCHDDGAQGEDDEHRGSVARIVRAEIEAAAPAAGCDREETVIKRALAAAWAAAAESHGENGRRR